VDALKLSGGSLGQPVQIQKAVFQPTAATNGQESALAGTANVPAGAPAPLVFTVQLMRSGYRVAIRGAGTPARLRQLAHAAGLKEARALDAVAGDPVVLDLTIQGPWLPAPDVTLTENAIASAAPVAEAEPAPAAASLPVPDRLTGTVTLHNASWKTDALPTAVEIAQATLHFGGGASLWDAVVFSYGPLIGTARLELPVCDAADEAQCVPIVNLEFPSLDAAELQTTLLGAEKKGTLLSTVIARLTPSAKHAWPAFQGTVKADSLELGPVTLEDFVAILKVSNTSAEITRADAGVLGGQVHLTGKIESGDKPGYSLDGSVKRVSPSDLCHIMELKCTGASFDGDGKLEMAGYTGNDLANSAKGKLHFDWKKGAIIGRTGASAEGGLPILTQFESWSGDAEIAGGAMTLKENQVRQGARKGLVNASVSLSDPPKVSFAPPKSAAAVKK
jgi:hypothetical protein